jgi:hypothetical protein
MFLHWLSQFAACQPKRIQIFPTWYQYLGEETVAGRCTPVFIFPDDIGKILLAVAEILLRIGALVAVAFVIYGGFRYVLSQGQPENASNALKTIINALIGLAIAASATVVVNLVARSLIP